MSASRRQSMFQDPPQPPTLELSRIRRVLNSIALNNEVIPGNQDVARPVSGFPEFSKAVCVVGVMPSPGLSASFYGG